MAEQERAGIVAPELRRVYFMRGAACALVIWTVLWSLGTIKYGPLGTIGFVLASLGSIWLAAWMHAARLAGSTQRAHDGSVHQTDAESKKAA